jgi:hypothetical protein
MYGATIREAYRPRALRVSTGGTMTPGLQTEIFTLLILVVVIARFLFRELRARTVRVSTLWVRPAVLCALTALSIWAASQVPRGVEGPIVPWLLGGTAIGIVVGFLVARSTRVESTGKAGVVRLRGSWITVAIWVAALALRFLVRILVGGTLFSTSPAVNGGTVILVAAAFTVFAVLIAQRIRALGLAGGAADQATT